MESENQTYNVIGTIQFFGGDINQLEGGANQLHTAMYKLDMPEGTTISQYSELIAQLLYGHLQEQDDGSGLILGLTSGDWDGVLSGTYEDMSMFCTHPYPKLLRMKSPEAWDVIRIFIGQWTISPETFSGIYYVCNIKEDSREVNPLEKEVLL